jgi:multimeric flavodoxin WrbA
VCESSRWKLIESFLHFHGVFCKQKGENSMPKVTILYHSFAGHTRKLSEAVEKGAASVNEVEVHRIEIIGDDIVKGRWQNAEIMAQLDASDAIIFGAPTSIGDVSGPMKCFIDATSSSARPTRREQQDQDRAGHLLRAFGLTHAGAGCNWRSAHYS